jgi:hypothetical protein
MYSIQINMFTNTATAMAEILRKIAIEIENGKTSGELPEWNLLEV